MADRTRIAILLLAAVTPASAARKAVVSPARDYVLARAAEIGGDPATASATFGEVLTRDPGNSAVALRALRQGMIAGDEKLATRAATSLDAAGALPIDGRPLLLVEAVKARDWNGALAQTDKLTSERNFAFLTPYLRAWIAIGTRQGDPLALIEPARGSQLGALYFAEQRALLLLALGRIEEGVAAFRGSDTRAIGARPLRLRLLFADALAHSGQKQRALDLIEGTDPVLAAARTRIGRGQRLPGTLVGPGQGIALLLLRVAAEFDGQRLAPIGLTLARDASFAAPADASAWLMTAELLGRLRMTTPALAALDHVAADDPMASAAAALRVALLVRGERTEAALAEARRATTRADADAGAWQRLGDVQLGANKPAEAAAAYGRAIALTEAKRAPPDVLWPLLLQQGGALDQAGDWAGAKAALQRALALAPDQAMVLNQLGYSQVARRDDVAAATALIERASRLRPDDPAITDSLGWVRYLGGDPQAAVPLLEKASSADPAEPTINEHLGDAYWSIGRTLEARYAWRAALVTADEKDRARLASKIDIGLSPATAAP